MAYIRKGVAEGARTAGKAARCESSSVQFSWAQPGLNYPTWAYDVAFSPSLAVVVGARSTYACAKASKVPPGLPDSCQF